MQTRSCLLFRKTVPPAVILFATAVTKAGCASAQTITPRPSDIFASATPCVAAFSTTVAATRERPATPAFLRHWRTNDGGCGHDVIKLSRTLFSVQDGMTFVHHKFFTGACDQSAEALAGERLGIQLTKLVRLDHNLNFYPNLSATGQYRFETATNLSAKLSNMFSVNAGEIDFYLSNPAVGCHKNNVEFTTGLGYTFQFRETSSTNS